MARSGAPGPGSGIEREVKLGAWPGFALPDLVGLPGGILAEGAAERDFESVHFDTADLRLIRSGITVRRRTDERPAWTVKLPEDGRHGDALVRRELRFDDDDEGGGVPAAVRSLVRASARSAALERVAVLHTRRRRLQLVDGAGVLVGEVDDDDVSVLDPATLDDQGGPRVAAKFREVEAEVGVGAPDGLVDDLVDRLRLAGAGAPDPTPKLVRALGPRALAPPDLVAVDLDEEATGADLVRAAITAGTMRMVTHDPIVRLDSDHEGVHQMRVGARRLRSDLRTLAPLLDGDWATALRAELKVVADALGPVRDADVLGDRLRRQGAGLPDADRRHVDAILRRLARHRDAARAAALEVLDGDRYAALLDRLVELAADPPVLPTAAAAASDVIPPLVGVAWTKLDRAVRKAGKHPTDEDLHRIRILAKRARYAADVAAPVVGTPARKLSSALADLQDVLGAHQDGAVAEAWLRSVSTSLNRPEALVAGQLVGLQRYEAASSGQEWRTVWKQAATKKHLQWLT